MIKNKNITRMPCGSIALMVFAFFFSNCSSKKENTGIISLEDVKLSTLTGQSIDTDEFEGKVVFINFWATWCGPCIQEMPSIDKAQALMTGKNVVFLIASNEDPEQIERFSKKHDYSFLYVQLNNMEELKIPALPTTFIFDAEGRLKFSETGSRMWNEPVNIELITKIINHEE
ncbi:MAG: TlpA disulfide reductase family protein [Bacteroidota bacterium]